MIPIRDNQPSSFFPVGTYMLIGVNFFVFMFQIQASGANDALFHIFGLVPGKYTVLEYARHFSLSNKLLSPFTYMFFHAGFLHFLGNMWSLYIFGDNVEAYFGTLRFLAFYILCGLISGFFHLLLNSASLVPTIGASGAIAGVMGAYFLLFPGAKILTLIPIIIIPIFVQIPAFIFLGFWFLMQFFNAAGTGAGSGIAWWAHVGGFLTGLILLKVNKKFPSSGVQGKIRHLTRKKHTPKLQVIVAKQDGNAKDLYGTIEISSIEALTGCRKLVAIPWGFSKSLYRVSIPAGIKKGSRLRLADIGNRLPGHGKGDLYLRVEIKNII